MLVSISILFTRKVNDPVKLPAFGRMGMTQRVAAFDNGLRGCGAAAVELAGDLFGAGFARLNVQTPAPVHARAWLRRNRRARISSSVSSPARQSSPQP